MWNIQKLTKIVQFWNGTLSWSEVYKWYKLLKNGCERENQFNKKVHKKLNCSTEGKTDKVFRDELRNL